MQHFLGINDNSPLYFLHIPKTAGTSISSVLEDIAEKRKLKILGPLLVDGLLERKNADWASVDILIGHLGLGPIDLGFDFFTLLRKPLDRLYSQYSYVTRTPGHFYYKRVATEKIDFLSWLKDEEFFNYNYNTQARYLSTKLNLENRLSNEDPTFHAKEFETSRISDVSIEVALETVHRSEWSGTVENLSEIAVYFKKRFCYELRIIPKKNVNHYSQHSYSTEEVKAAKKLTELDEDLYHHVAKF